MCNPPTLLMLVVGIAGFLIGYHVLWPAVQLWIGRKR